MMYSSPIPTNDGTIIDLKEIETKPLDPRFPDVVVGECRAWVRWEGGEVGPAAREFIKRLGDNPNSPDAAWFLNVRSYLAQAGLDVVGGTVEFVQGDIIAEVTLRFLIDQQREDGATYFPLFEGTKDYYSRMAIRALNLVFVPKEATPLDDTEIGDLLALGRLALPKGWRREADGNISLPLNGKQHGVGGIRAIHGGDWAGFFTHGKRGVAVFQELPPAANGGTNFLRQRLDVREGAIRSGPGISLVLETETTHQSVAHAASRLLRNLADDQPRRFELLTAQPNIPVPAVAPRGRFYMEKGDSGKVARGYEAPPSAASPGNLQSITLDQRVKNTPEITALVRYVSSLSPQGVIGVVIGRDGSWIVPRDKEVQPGLWAAYVAKHRQALDARPLNAIPLDTVQAIRDHPGVAALRDHLEQSASHHTTNLFVADTLPTPETIEYLAKLSGAGIGGFFACKLQEPPSTSGRYAHLSLAQEPLGRYRQLVDSGTAQIFWLPPQGEMRQLIGTSFVGLSARPFLEQLGLVVVVYCSHLDHPQFNRQFETQVPPFIEQLGSLGMNVGVLTGASSGLMTRLSNAIRGHRNVMSLGVATLFHDQTPDFTPEILTSCAEGDRRFRQALMARWGDVHLALSGGAGTTGEIIDAVVDMKFAHGLPAPIGMVDLAQIKNWDHLVAHFDRISGPLEGGESLTPAWTRQLLKPRRSLAEFFTEDIRPFVNNPLEWMEQAGVPRPLQESALRWHIKNARYVGRPIAPFLKQAINARLGDRAGDE